jgi:hypothetical protein
MIGKNPGRTCRGNAQVWLRHCEVPTGRANARPMTGSATMQSILPLAEPWIASLRSQ